MKQRATDGIQQFPGGIWLRFLLCLLVTGTLAFGEINVPLRAIPQAIPATINARLGQPVLVTLRCSGAMNQVAKFRIRTQPQFGSLSEPKYVTNDSATVLYQCSAKSGPVIEDRFSYSVQTSAGVSVPVEIAIRMVEDPPLLMATESVDFGAVLLGKSGTQQVMLENRGGGVAEGEFKVQGDFKVDGRGTYRIPAGKKVDLNVIFTPTVPGKTAGAILLQSGRQITLLAEGLGGIKVQPAELELRLDPASGIRKGTWEILNRTVSLQTVAVRGDSRLNLPATIELPAGDKITVPIALGRNYPEALAGLVEFTASGFTETARVRAASLEANFRVRPLKIQFGQVPCDRVAVQAVELENSGGAVGTFTAAIEAPFRLKSPPGPLSVNPGDKVMIQVEFAATHPGLGQAQLTLKTSSGDLQIPVFAEAVVATSEKVEPQPVSAPTVVPTPYSMPVPMPVPMLEVNEADLPPLTPLKPAKKITPKLIGETTAELLWEATPNASYRLECQVPYLDEKGKICFSWKPLENVQVSQQGTEVTARLTRLRPNSVYRLKAVALDGSGKSLESSSLVEIITLPRSPLITPLRVLLLCLAVLLGVAAKRAWSRPI